MNIRRQESRAGILPAGRALSASSSPASPMGQAGCLPCFRDHGEAAARDPEAPRAEQKIRQLVLSNRQKTCKVDFRLLRRVARCLLEDFFKAESYDLGVILVGSRKIGRLNETYLRHEGPTDIITFNYAEPDSPMRFHGELFICVDVAVRQARRFRTTWQRESVRYLVHGLLHLDGYDDTTPEARKEMKRVENKLVKRLVRKFLIERPISAGAK